VAYQVGDRIGDYEVTSILGAGGMGAVYQVRNVISNRVEAMKILLPELLANTEVADRFLREIRVLGSLEHPNIAALRTAQRVDHQVLMIMECVEGLSLDALLKRGTIPREHQLSILAQVLSALDFAHQRGIIHRDIKPANIMVTPTGHVKLMDFGIAKLAVDRKLTATGSTLGSVYYMSPEQIQGADSVDARSDIYALGICLYEMTTGKRPFDAPSEYSLMSAHLHEAPRPPVQLDPTIPEPLNQIILMSIAKDPGQRFQSAAAMLSAVNHVREQLGYTVAAPAVGDKEAASPARTLAASAAAAGTPPPVVAPAKSRRGVYMALGSLVTVGVVVAALMLGPKYFRTGAATTTSGQPAVVPAATSSVPAVPTPATGSGTQGESAPPVSTKPQEAVNETRHPAPPPITVRQRVAAVPAGQPSNASPVPQQPIAQPAQHTATQPESAKPETQNPAPAPNAAALNELREQYNQMAVRASTVKSGLQSLQNQMGGLGLRADMRENAARMDVLMGEAMASIRAGDMERARRNLDMADRTIEKIEKFLGR
jgi:hypothetical protein